jgi:hypothetical protein
MIQRAQSVWMFLAAAAVFTTLKLPFFAGMNPIDNILHNVIPHDNIILEILTCSLGSLLLVNIFLFKHRNWQFKICMFAIFIECVDIFLLIREDNRLKDGNFTIWSALHLLILFFIIKASMGIYKDDRLIRESNRLR